MDRLSCQDGDLGAMVARFKLLRDRKVTAPAIPAHFLRHHIAPLQKRPHLVWDYEGPSDPSRLDSENMPYSLIRLTVAGFFGTGVNTKLPSEVLPLWDDPKKEEILGDMPEFF